jgi:hypothetical protein
LVSSGIFNDGSTVAIDMDNVKRSPNAYERISFRLLVTGMGASTQARMSGNCTTGTWRISRGRSNGGAAFMVWFLALCAQIQNPGDRD